MFGFLIDLICVGDSRVVWVFVLMFWFWVYGVLAFGFSCWVGWVGVFVFVGLTWCFAVFCLFGFGFCCVVCMVDFVLRGRVDVFMVDWMGCGFVLIFGLGV